MIDTIERASAPTTCSDLPGRLRDLCECKGRDGRPDPRASDCVAWQAGMRADGVIGVIDPPPELVRSGGAPRTQSFEPVGTALARRIARIIEVKASSSCGCKTLADEMDKWGIHGCERRRQEIVAKLISKREMLVESLRESGMAHAAIGWSISIGIVPEMVLRAGANWLLDAAIADVRSQPRTLPPAPSLRLSPVGHGLNDTPLGEKYAITPTLTDRNEVRPPSEWFDRVICISLDRRPDRWTQFQSHIQQCDWPFAQSERFSAIDGQEVLSPAGWKAGAGAWGCLQSHLRLLEDVLSSGAKSVLIMEDDAQPVADMADRVRQWQTGIPDNWQGLWFGGEHAGRTKSLSTIVNAQTILCRYVTRTHCFGLRQPFLGQFYRFLSDPETLQDNTTDHIDHAIARFMRGGNHALYCPSEWLVAQAATHSDISNRQEKHRMFK